MDDWSYPGHYLLVYQLFDPSKNGVEIAITEAVCNWELKVDLEESF
jgi:hypothetical protein